MFKRKKQAAAAAAKPPPPPSPPPTVVHRKVAPKLTISECLQQAQGALQKLRTINPGDLQAFPLLNEVQRLVQQLKEATALLPLADKEAWSFQISELEDEFRDLADMVVSRADAAPKPEPRLASQASYSNSGTSARSPASSSLLSPSNSSRVQQAVALFSRQDGFLHGRQSASLRRVQATGSQQQQTQEQQHHQDPHQQSRHQQLQQQLFPQQPQQQYLKEHYAQQYYHRQHLQAAEQQAYPHQGPSSVTSTPARSESSFMHLTEEEREMLAQKQQALLQKHFQYLAQQREAEEQAAAGAAAVPRGAPATAQQPNPPAAMQQQDQQQYQKQQQNDHQQEIYRQEHLQQYRQQVQQQQAQGHAAAVYYNEQQQQPQPAHYQQVLHQVGGVPAGPEAQQRSEEREGGLAAVGDEDDLFSGLDIMATDEHHSLSRLSVDDAAAAARPQSHAKAYQQQLGDTVPLPPQRGPTAAGFRPASHSMPHRLNASSQMGSRADNAGPFQQEVHASGEAALTAELAAVPAAQGALQQHHQQQQYALPQPAQQQGVQQLELQPQPPYSDVQQAQQHQYLHHMHPRQLSTSVHGYHRASRGTAAPVNGSLNALTSPQWHGAASSGSTAQASPFSQAAADAGQAASASAASDAASTASHPIRKKTSHMKLGYGVEDEANGRQQAGGEGESNPVEAVRAVDAAGPSGSRILEQQQQYGPQQEQLQHQQLGHALGYEQQQPAALAVQGAWALQQPQRQAHLHRPESQAGSSYLQQPHQEQQPPAQQSAPGQTVPESQPQTPLHGLHHVQHMQQPYPQQQQYPLQAAQQPPLSPIGLAATDAVRYSQVQAAEGQHQEPPPNAQQHLPQQYPAVTLAVQLNPLQQQALHNHHAGPDDSTGSYPQVQVWQQDESALQAAQQQHQQAPHHKQQAPKDVLYAQQAYIPHQLQQDAPSAQLPPHPQQHKHHHQQQQQPVQSQASTRSLPHAEGQQQGGLEAAAAAQAYISSFLPPTPEEQARTRLLQQIADSVGSRPGQAHAYSGSDATGTPAPRYQGNAGFMAAAASPALDQSHLQRPDVSPGAFVAAAPVTGGLGGIYGAVDLAVAGPAAGVAPVAVFGASTDAATWTNTAAAAAAASSPAAAAGRERPSSYISAFLQSAQGATAAECAAAAVTPGTATPRPATTVTAAAVLPAAVGPYGPSAASAAPVAVPSTPVFAATPPTAPEPHTLHIHAQPAATASALADSGAPSGPSPSPLSLPISSGALRTRSRVLISGGGVSSGGMLGADPAASLPSASSLPNVADLETFLNGITGSVDACRGAAEQRARDMVGVMGAALAQAQKVEAGVQQQRRAVKAALAGVTASISQLEADQAAAVEGEDFDTAAALDEQLTQMSLRRTAMDEQVGLLADALQRAAALRLQVLGRQAEVWSVAGAYLAQLQSGQQEMAAALASQAEREAQAAAVLHRAAQDALAQRHAALAERSTQLEGATAQVAARVAAATAPAEADRQRRNKARAALQAEVESLRALLVAKEAALAEAEAAVAEAEAEVRQQAAAYDGELARLEDARRQLEAEAAQVMGHEQALQDSERQAEARSAAVEAHQSQLRLQAEALGAAAGAMRREAGALAARLAAEARSQEQRGALLRADERAREELKGLERCISDLSADLSRLAEQRGRLAAERAAAQERLAGLQRVLPELEAAKRTAAAAKDFREAARLSGELRALTAQADAAAAQLARLTGDMSELAAAEGGKVSELEELRALVHEAQRHAAEAHHRYLVFSLGLSRVALEGAASAELYEEARALQAEVAAEEAEALALERTWGFARPMAAAAAATGAATAARRRTSLELTAQFSRQSLGGLSAQSSRSLSTQLPPAAMNAQPQLQLLQHQAPYQQLPPPPPQQQQHLPYQQEQKHQQYEGPSSQVPNGIWAVERDGSSNTTASDALLLPSEQLTTQALCSPLGYGPPQPPAPSPGIASTSAAGPLHPAGDVPAVSPYSGAAALVAAAATTAAEAGISAAGAAAAAIIPKPGYGGPSLELPPPAVPLPAGPHPALAAADYGAQATSSGASPCRVFLEGAPTPRAAVPAAAPGQVPPPQQHQAPAQGSLHQAAVGPVREPPAAELLGAPRIEASGHSLAAEAASSLSSTVVRVGRQVAQPGTATSDAATPALAAGTEDLPGGGGSGSASTATEGSTPAEPPTGLRCDSKDPHGGEHVNGGDPGAVVAGSDVAGYGGPPASPAEQQRQPDVPEDAGDVGTSRGSGHPQCSFNHGERLYDEEEQERAAAAAPAQTASSGKGGDGGAAAPVAAGRPAAAEAAVEAVGKK